MKVKCIVLFIFTVLFSSYSIAQDTEKIVEITTDLGIIKVKLYNETPLHRDNFLKLVNEGFYDGTLFHRVINQFMIQGGDPESIGAPAEKQLGDGGPKYTIPAEFNPNLIHKKGVLAAAREGDQVNPEKRSSGSQFYIVQGRKYTETDLQRLQQRNEQVQKQQLMNVFFQQPENKAYLDRLTAIKQAQDKEAMTTLIKEIEPIIVAKQDKTPKKYSLEQLKMYREIGGTPHLDGGYTVFGEVIEGLDVVDKIAELKTGTDDRPVVDIKVTMRVL